MWHVVLMWHRTGWHGVTWGGTVSHEVPQALIRAGMTVFRFPIRPGGTMQAPRTG
jgi:hypothetical protein